MQPEQKARRPTLSLRYGSSFGLVIAILCWSLLGFVGPSNADWLAYQYLYEEAGGWLAADGRDPAFLALLSFICGVTDYEGFRVLVALYFLLFTFWFLAKWKHLAVADRYLLSHVAALPLLLPRFTVQIREGIAITLVLAALTLLWRREVGGRAGLLPAATVMLIAVAFHGGTAIFLAMLLVPRVWRFVFGRSSRAAGVLVACLAAVASVGALSAGLLDAAAIHIGQLVWGGFATLDTQISADKGAYWLLRCVIAAYLVAVARAVSAQAPQTPASFLRLGMYAVVPLQHLLVLYLVFTAQSAYLASAAIRMLNMTLLLLLVIVGFRARKTWPLLGVVFVLLADQVRTLTSSAPHGE